MYLKDFSGGLSKRLAPNLINPNEAVECTNVDLTSAIIKPLKDMTATNKTIPLDKPVFTEFKGIYLSSNSGTSYVEFNDTLYIANGINTVRRTTDGINIYDIGLTSPSTKLTTTTSFSVSFSFSNLDYGDDITFTTGSYTYLIQYKTLAGDIDYEVVTFSYTGTKGIRLTISSMSNLESVTLYRKVDTKYRLVGESTSSLTIDDIVFDIGTKSVTEPYKQALGTRNYVYTYYSSITGFESAPAPASDDLSVKLNNVVITGFIAPTDLTVDTIRLYRVGGTLVNPYLVESLTKTVTTYTDTKTDIQVLGTGTLLETTGFIKPKTGLRFLTEYNSALFGSLDSTLFFSNPGLVDQWTENNFIVFPEHITGLGVTQNGLMVFSRNKTWLLVGDSLSNYSKYLLNASQGCVTNSTVAYVENNLLWLSLDGICVSQGGSIELLSWSKLGRLVVNPVIAKVYENQYFLFHETGAIVVDFRGGVKFLGLDILVRGAYYSATFDKLFLLKPSDIGMYEYNSGGNLTFNYRTGQLADNGVTNIKTYKNLYVRTTGSVSLDLYLDGNVVGTYTLTSGFNDIRFPQESSIGYYIELDFYGTGSVIEVNYVAEGRQNGR